MAVAELVVKLIGDVSGFQRTMGQVARDVQKTGKSLANAGKGLTQSLTLPMGGIAVASLAMAGDFQASMSKVSALGGIAGADLKKLEAQALQLGASTQFSAKQAAEGMAEYAAAGFTTTEISEAMAGTLDLAAAAQIDVGQAAGISIATLGQFNLKADQSTRVADTMAKTAAAGALTITELAESLKYVGPVAGTMGHSLEDTAAAVAMLSAAGIKGSEAGTALRMGLIRIVKPTKQAQEAIDKYGLSLTDSEGRAKPMIEIVKQLEEKQVSLADVTKLVGVNAVSAWTALQTKGSAALGALTEQVKATDMTAASMAATLRDNLKGSFEAMTGSIETLGISIGMALTPAARGLMEVIQKLAENAVGLVEWFRSLNPNIQNAAIAFASVVAIAGPVVLVIGKIIFMVGGLIKSLAVAKTAIILFTSATGLGLIVVAVGLATAAIVYFKDDIYDAFVAINEYLDRFVAEFNLGLEVLSDAYTTFVDDFWRGVETINQYIDQFIADFNSGLNRIAEYITNFVGPEFVEKFKKAFDTIKEYAGQFIDVISGAWEKIDKVVGFATGRFQIATDAIEQNSEQLDINATKNYLASLEVDRGILSLKRNTKEVQVNSNEIKKQSNELKKGTDETNKNTKSTGQKTKADKESAEGAKELAKKQKEATKALEEHGEKVQQIVSSSNEYKKILAGIKDKTISAAEGTQKLKKLYEDAEIAISDMAGAEREYQELLKQHGSVSNIPIDSLQAYIEKLSEAETKLANLGGDSAPSEFPGLDQLGKQVEDQFIAGIGDAFAALINGGSVRDSLQSLGAGIGQTVGAGIGTALGGPIGGAIGGALGEKILGGAMEKIAKIGTSAKGSRDGVRLLLDGMFPGIGTAVDHFFGDKLFGGDSLGTQTRKAIDGWFAKQFDANRIMVVIDGQMKRLRDFNFGAGMFGSESSPAGQYFAGLESSAKSAFEGIAVGFTSMLGLGGEASKGLAAVLATELGGSLNNLQIMVQGLGISFDEMKAMVIDTMLAGELSFKEAASALNSIAQISQKGIPDGIGFTVQAFENLKAAGVKGGRASTDAMRDMAEEARELGIKTLPALMQNLVASGKFTQKEIEQVFEALSVNGIDSVEKLADATDEQLISVLARLQEQEFPFAEAVDDALDLAEAINQIPKSKDVTFNLKTNMDSNTREAIDSGYVPNAGQTQSVVPRQSAMGNVFSAGAILPFAKGGVVGDYTTFDIGSMAERGPEAIMPLERLPDGRLGVLSAPSNSGKSTVNNFTINAPYAQPGVAETIRRELDKYFDRKNRMPGIRQ
jgi:TP901 family phage tail tape measure protein